PRLVKEGTTDRCGEQDAVVKAHLDDVERTAPQRNREAGVAAAALAGRAILRQARGGQGMGAMFQSLTGAGSVGGAMKVRLCQHGQLHVRAAPVLTSLCRALHKPPGVRP
ncbi:MAG: hypothetical protein ACPIOQ_39940, partial [Promethearchaeia archaeon]